MLCYAQPPAISPPVKKPDCHSKLTSSTKPPPHIKFGTPEDTLAGCQSFVPKPPKKDVVRELFNFPKKLRYLAAMEAVHPEDEDRNFIIEYALSDGKIGISEIEKRNSGRRGGCFLSPTLIPKPGTDRDNPLYYTPEDFFVGAKLNVYNHRFVITGIDLFVYRYVEANPDKFCRELRDNLRNYVVRQGLLEDEIERRAFQELEANRETDQEPINDRSNNYHELNTSEEAVDRRCQAEIPRDSQRNFQDNFVPMTMSDDKISADAVPNMERYESPVPMEKKRLAWADQVGTIL